METENFASDVYPQGRRTKHILLIDDNAQLRSMLARHILFACRERGRSCAIYHTAENAQTRLTFFEPAPTPAGDSRPNELDFAVFESNSPRQALNWIWHNPLASLIIVSDVVMPVDTEVGLDGFLDGLAMLALPVNLLFVSSETQSKAFVQQLMSPQQAYFVTKGSEGWSKLPDALVRHAETLPCRPILRPKAQVHSGYANTEVSPFLSTTATATATVGARSYVTAPSLQPQTVTSANANFERVASKSTTLRSAMIGSNETPPSSPKLSFWSRLLHFFHN